MIEAQVVYNNVTNLFNLIFNGEILSTSRYFRHWDYHQKRGSLPKSVTKHGITSFVLVGFTEDNPPNIPVKAPAIIEPAPVEAVSLDIGECEQCKEAGFNWFGTSINPLAKKRGRPRKVKKADGITVHKMEDDEISVNHLSISELDAINRNFKMFLKSMNNRDAISEVAIKFQLSYKQTYKIIESLTV